MKLATALKVARFAELESGDLFLLPQPEGSCVAIAAVDGDDSAEKLAILLGPTFPYGLIGPHLMPLSGATVISFGKDFAVRLPVQADAWCVRRHRPKRLIASLSRIRGCMYARVLPTLLSDFLPTLTS